jgi:leukotriene-A4 hydrolase
VATIDWESKFYTPGLPPKPEFDTTLANQCYELAEKWKDAVSLVFTLPILSPSPF